MLNSAESMLRLAPQIKHLCHSLFTNFKIDYYEYQQVDHNGNGFLLASNQSVYKDLIDFNLIGYEKLNLDFSTYQQIGYYIHDFMNISRPDLQTYLEILENYGYGHVFSFNEIVYDKLIPTIIQYTFAAKITDDQSFNQHYLENIEALKDFTRYFNSELYNFKHKIEYFNHTSNVTAKKKVIKKFKKNIILNEIEYDDENKISTKSEPLVLSKRQREIIHWYLKGKSAEETANLLNLSKRTVENHFYKLKKKYACTSKTQLLIKLFKSGILHL